jgi:hypothetical protein
MRPLTEGLPLRNTHGHGHDLARSTSSWNRPPSMATWRTRGLSTAIRLSACTTSGQLWQVRLIQVVEGEITLQGLDLLDDLGLDLGRVAAGLQQRQQQRGELVAHRHGGEVHAHVRTDAGDLEDGRRAN